MVKLKGAEDYPFYFGTTSQTLKLAGDLRGGLTKTEKLLWQELRERKLDGFRFRRQHPIKDFIVDFFCYEARLVIEIDGSVHLDPTQSDRDIERTRILNQLGLKVIRFTNEEVESKINHVIALIKNELIASEL